jgi:hypothetical protein
MNDEKKKLLQASKDIQKARNIMAIATHGLAKMYLKSLVDGSYCSLGAINQSIFGTPTCDVKNCVKYPRKELAQDLVSAVVGDTYYIDRYNDLDTTSKDDILDAFDTGASSL